MKSFVFSLERIRSYREQILNREKETLTRMQRQRDELKQKLSNIEQFKRNKSAEMQRKQREGVTSYELSAHSFFISNTQQQIKDLRQEIEVANQEIAKQIKVVLAATKECSSLDRLEEKQLEEYRLEVKRDEEVQMLENVSMTMVRNATATT